MLGTTGAQHIQRQLQNATERKAKSPRNGKQLRLRPALKACQPGLESKVLRFACYAQTTAAEQAHQPAVHDQPAGMLQLGHPPCPDPG